LRDRAALARRLQNVGITDWREFIHSWIGFNAVYGAVTGVTERDRLMNAVRRLVQPEEAARILAQVKAASDYFSELPPGDMRRDRDHPRFREQSIEDLRIVNDEVAEPVERLAHLMSVVYRIRCNLIHGSKDPENVRDRRLVTASQQILGLALDAVLPRSDNAPPHASGCS
jgi:hypothetical protein